MSYPAIQTNVLDVLQLMTEFDATNSTEKDFRVLGNSKDQYAVLMRGNSPGGGQQGILDGKKSYVRLDDWVVDLHLFAKYTTNQLDTRELVDSLSDAIEAHFAAYPTLNGIDTIRRVEVDATQEPEPYTDGVEQFWRQLITIEVDEYSTVYVNEDSWRQWIRWDGTETWDGTEAWL